MTARVLVVDDIPANVKLLEARLSAEYFNVLTASAGDAALDLCHRERIDVVLLDVMMPGMDGFEVCRRLKAHQKTHHIPVVMVTALDQPADKLQGLEAGADDFLTKPVDDIALITRVKNLARLKMLNDEMAMRAVTSGTLGLDAGAALARDLGGDQGRILLVEDHPRSGRRLHEALSAVHDVVLEPDPHAALMTVAATERLDLLLVSLALRDVDGLRLCSQVRSLDRARHLPIVVLVDPGEEARLLRGLDMGVNDYLVRPIDTHEMLARTRTQIRRKRYTELLRTRLAESVEHAVTDPLTGLYNRRYLESHLRTLTCESAVTGRPLSVLIADVDHFKRINDTHGHDAGDKVLRELADRLRQNIRGVDLACRLGGEEFVVIMPETAMATACQIGERLRRAIAAELFMLSADTELVVTTSVGVASLEAPHDTAEALMKRADTALYAAKRNGRNRVTATAA